MLFRFNSYQGSVWFTQASAVAGHVLDAQAHVLQYVGLVDINRQLTAQNTLLQQQNEALRTVLLRQGQDTALIDSLAQALPQGQHLIAAQVITNSVKQKDNYLTLDRGTLHGVRPEMGVVCGQGLVGITYLVSERYSVVLPLLNSRSNVSCRLRGTGYFGTLRWEGYSPMEAAMEDIPLHAICHEGDVVETSGFSSVFPPGIFVGRVTRVGYSKDGLSIRIEVRLGADLACTRDVYVVANERRDEIEQLENRTRE